MARVDTELLGLQIVALDDASVVGEVDGLIIDDRAMKVAGFLVDLGLFEASVLPFGSASAVGADAIIVPGADALTSITADPALDTLAMKDITISDARVITRAGKTVGSIGDFFVDTDSGDVVGMEFIADDQSIYPKDVAVLPSAAVLRLGRDIIVVSDDYLQRLQRDAGSLDRLTHDDTPATIANPPAADAPSELESPPKPESPHEADTPATIEVDEPAIVAEPEPAAVAEPAPVIVAEPEPATATEPAIAVEAADEDEVTADPPAAPTQESDLGAQPRHFLIGKRVLRRIEGVDGEVIAEEGDLVTYEMIQRARNSDQLLILSLNVE